MDKSGNSHDSSPENAGAAAQSGLVNDRAGMQPPRLDEADSSDVIITRQGKSASHTLAEIRHDPDAIHRLFETGKYPYKTKLSVRSYEKQKAELQVELLKVQDWVKASGQKIVVLFEGRDAAGKGGDDKALHGTS